MNDNDTRIQNIQTGCHSAEQRIKFLGLLPLHSQLLNAARPVFDHHVDVLVDEFYTHLLKFEAVRTIITDEAKLAKLKLTQKIYCRQLFSGCYDTQYVESRYKVGLLHSDIGIPLCMYTMAFSYLRDMISQLLQQQLKSPQQTIEAFQKICTFDLGLFIDAYNYANNETLIAEKNTLANSYDRQMSLARSVSNIQKSFIGSDDPLLAFESILEEMLNLTGSEFGLIGDVLIDENEQPYLKVVSLSNISWNAETEALYKQNKQDGLEFHNLDNLLGEIIKTGKTVISNSPATDLRSAGVPHGHPVINRFMGVPIMFDQQIIGLIGLANCQTDYNSLLINYIQPFMDSLEVLIKAKRRKYELSRLEKAVNQSSDLILNVDPDTLKYVYANQTSVTVLGLGKQDIFKLTPDDLIEKSGLSIAERLLELKSGHSEQVHFEAKLKLATNEKRDVEVTFKNVYNGNKLFGYINTIHDISDQKKLEAERKANEAFTKRLAYYDQLTNLPNRNALNKHIEKLLSFSSQQQKTNVALIIIGIKRLTDINDALGHAVSDELIKLVGERINRVVRGADMLGKVSEAVADHSVSRLTGDEFAIGFLITCHTDIARIIDRIDGALLEPVQVSDSEIIVKLDYGVATETQETTTVEHLFTHANIAYHLSKQSNQVVIYNNDIGEKAKRKALVSQRLELAIKYHTGLEIYFQPQIKLGSQQELIGAEVLLRWHDELLGPVSPAEFIPVAEDRGLINKLSEFVITESFTTLRQWMEENYLNSKSNFKLALNISARDLENFDFIESLLSHLHSNSLLNHQVELELTETSIINQPDVARLSLSRLGNEGFAFAIDDFGTGHSSLTYLKNIRPELLKIDMSFVHEALTNQESLKVIEAIVATANIFGIKTLAEGIEDQQTASLLERIGCDYGQGYFIEKPLNKVGFEKNWLGEQHHLNIEPAC